MSHPSRFLAACLAAAAPLLAEQTVHEVGETFVCYYQNAGDRGSSEAFGASGLDWTQDAMACVERALRTWDGLIGQTAARQLQVGLYWVDFKELYGSDRILGGALNSTATATSATCSVSFTLPELVWREGVNVSIGANYDIAIGFSTSFAYYMGEEAGGDIGQTFDFQSLIMHELGHALGMASTATGTEGKSGEVTFGTDSNGNVCFTTFDSLMRDKDGRRVIDIAAENLAAGGKAVAYRTGDTIHLEGSELTVYNPQTWATGSSGVHFTATDEGELMQYSMGTNTFRREPTDAELGVMRSMGWDIAIVPEPATVALSLLGLLVLLRRRRGA